MSCEIETKVLFLIYFSQAYYLSKIAHTFSKREIKLNLQNRIFIKPHWLLLSTLGLLGLQVISQLIFSHWLKRFKDNLRYIIFRASFILCVSTISWLQRVLHLPAFNKQLFPVHSPLRPQSRKLLYFIKSKAPWILIIVLDITLKRKKKKNSANFNGECFLIPRSAVAGKALANTGMFASLTSDLFLAVASMSFCPHNSFCLNVES